MTGEQIDIFIEEIKSIEMNLIGNQNAYEAGKLSQAWRMANFLLTSEEFIEVSNSVSEFRKNHLKNFFQAP